MDGKRLVKILFIVMTHGDEQVGLSLWNSSPQGYNRFCQWQTIIANPKAMELSVRYIESDLNRSFNTPDLKTYEERRAKVLTPIISSYDVVYDIHQTFVNDNMQDCIFVNERTKQVKQAISPLSARYVVVDNNKDFKGRFATSVAKVGITIEYSRKGSYEKDRKAFLYDFDRIVENKHLHIKRIWMSTYIAIPKNNRPKDINLKNFKKISEREKSLLSLPHKGEFYPIFTDVYPDYYCFINRKIKSP